MDANGRVLVGPDTLSADFPVGAETPAEGDGSRLLHGFAVALTRFIESDEVTAVLPAPPPGAAARWSDFSEQVERRLFGDEERADMTSEGLESPAPRPLREDASAEPQVLLGVVDDRPEDRGGDDPDLIGLDQRDGERIKLRWPDGPLLSAVRSAVVAGLQTAGLQPGSAPTLPRVLVEIRRGWCVVRDDEASCRIDVELALVTPGGDEQFGAQKLKLPLETGGGEGADLMAELLENLAVAVEEWVAGEDIDSRVRLMTAGAKPGR